MKFSTLFKILTFNTIERPKKILVEKQINKKTVTVHSTNGPHGLRSVFKVTYDVLSVDKRCVLPNWSIVMIGLGLTMVAIVLSASLYLTYGSQQPGTYGESCVGRSCVKHLGLKCLNGICTCSFNQYYARGCQLKKLYLEECNGNSSCIDGTSCLDGICNCNSSSFWTGDSCELQRIYGGACNTNKQCLVNTELYCDSKRLKCLCQNGR